MDGMSLWYETMEWSRQSSKKSTKLKETDKAWGETDEDKEIDKDRRKGESFRQDDQAEGKMRF